MKPFKVAYIAVVGASTDPEKYGNKVFSDMIKAGWNAEGINIKGGEVAGKKLFTKLEELPGIPDIIVTVVPPAVTEKVVEEAKAKGVSHVWMQPGSESVAAVRKAQELGMEATFNQCIMITSGLW